MKRMIALGLMASLSVCLVAEAQQIPLELKNTNLNCVAELGKSSNRTAYFNAIKATEDSVSRQYSQAEYLNSAQGKKEIPKLSHIPGRLWQLRQLPNGQKIVTSTNLAKDNEGKLAASFRISFLDGSVNQEFVDQVTAEAYEYIDYMVNGEIYFTRQSARGYTAQDFMKAHNATSYTDSAQGIRSYIFMFDPIVFPIERNTGHMEETDFSPEVLTYFLESTFEATQSVNLSSIVTSPSERQRRNNVARPNFRPLPQRPRTEHAEPEAVAAMINQSASSAESESRPARSELATNPPRISATHGSAVILQSRPVHGTNGTVSSGPTGADLANYRGLPSLQPVSLPNGYTDRFLIPPMPANTNMTQAENDQYLLLRQAIEQGVREGLHERALTEQRNLQRRRIRQPWL